MTYRPHVRPALAAVLGILAGLTYPASAREPGQIPVSNVIYPDGSDPAALAAWASASVDTGGRPFVIVDKPAARVFAFSGSGRLLGEAPALLGLARGDETPPGIGAMGLADITPNLRITPAGRYEAQLGLNLAGHQVLWVDYAAALSLHAVVTGKVTDHRLERLATASILDNRISYGCINVPAIFFRDVVEPLFSRSGGIVYILPEITQELPQG